MNEKLRKIVNHYGINTQLKYFQSEIFELNEACLPMLVIPFVKHLPMHFI